MPERQAGGLHHVSPFGEQHGHALQQPLQPGMLVRTPRPHVIQSETLKSME